MCGTGSRQHPSRQSAGCDRWIGVVRDHFSSFRADRCCFSTLSPGTGLAEVSTSLASTITSTASHDRGENRINRFVASTCEPCAKGVSTSGGAKAHASWWRYAMEACLAQESHLHRRA
jgi:hypothetical protein